MDFLQEMFGSCEGDMFVCSLDNVRGQSAEQHVLTRDPARIRAFVKQYDVPGRGTFFCVSTLKGRRQKTNAVQVGAAWADIDLKSVDLDKDAIVQRLGALERPPTRIHSSGGGLHAYWMLDRPASDMALVEKVVKKIRVAVAGDKMVCQSVALMRLPGTHNSKRGDPVLVEVLRDTGDRYSLEELDEWQPPIVILEKGQEPPNPFLEQADRFGFKPPMDVDARLAEMKHHGEGDTAIHPTQLSVTASLMSRGEDEDAIVEKVLEATRAAVGDAKWNWKKEEEAIRAMCRDWEAKHGTRKTGTDDKVVSLKNVKALRKEKVSKKEVHVILARGMLEELKQRGEAILLTKGQLWWYSNSRWRLVPSPEVKEWIDTAVERGCQALNLVSKNTLVNEVRGYLMRQPSLHHEEVAWDAHGMIATKSGLLDPTSGRVAPHSPEHRTTRWIDCEFMPRVKATKFKQMLSDMLDPADVSLLQEVVGSFLVENRPRSMRRALVLVGGSNAGKSTIIAAVSGFLSQKINSTRIDTLENTHGLMGFLSSDPWVLHEAFEQGRWHFSSNVKTLLSGDAFGVNIKNGPMVTHVYNGAVLWGTNTPPQFRESTKAMQNRLVVIQCTRTFEGEPVGVAREAVAAGLPLAEYVLKEERSGILNWALEGFERLRARGSFDLPTNALEAMHEMWLQSNIAAGFMEDCVELDPGSMVAVPDFCGAFRAWWEESRGDQHVPSNQSISMALRSLGNASISTNSLRDRTMRYYGGLKLNDSGLEFWQSFSSSRAALDGSVRMSARAEEVNKAIPR